MKVPRSCSGLLILTRLPASRAVLELCAGGPILRVPEGGQVKPLAEDEARHVFQQLLLGAFIPAQKLRCQLNSS